MMREMVSPNNPYVYFLDMHSNKVVKIRNSEHLLVANSLKNNAVLYPACCDHGRNHNGRNHNSAWVVHTMGLKTMSKYSVVKTRK